MKSSIKFLKVACLVAFAAFFGVWIAWGTLSTVGGTDVVSILPSTAEAFEQSDDYVGSETCMACHEDQHKEFKDTKHAKLGSLPAWKNKPEGCESCHGAGREHVEAGGDKSKIVSFANMNSKQVSETCLSCHAGKEAHNNFRRGEHWRNDVGCTDCHTAHGNVLEQYSASSATLVGDATAQNPTRATRAMLKQAEPQLCLTCHTDTKAQFTKPFHHKVLEGAMSCSDCHNAHGGFEAKQTKLAIGADAACIKCHTDKQGPFVFEHGPVKTEGCASCHTPHGSNNPKMLARSNVRQLCLECHSSVANSDPGAPQAPHNQATARYQNCTICHVKVHGSNANRTFFR